MSLVKTRLNIFTDQQDDVLGVDCRSAVYAHFKKLGNIIHMMKYLVWLMQGKPL